VFSARRFWGWKRRHLNPIPILKGRTMLSLKPYRRAAVPLLAVQTPDPMEILRLALREAQNGTTAAVLQWDCIHGIVAANTEAQPIAGDLNGNQDPAIATGNPIEALRALEALGEPETPKTIVIAFGMADVLADPQAATPARQALWNLRDCLSQSGALLVLTVPIGWTNPFPDDIAVDVSALPTAEDHQTTAKRLSADAGIDAPDDDAQTKIGDALLGLSSFASEQALALSLTKQGIDIESLRARKRQQISETRGLSVYTGKETFSDLGGVEQAKTFFRGILSGKRRPGGIVFIDEGEKFFGSVAGDTSGTKNNALGSLLPFMDKPDVTGSIFIGPPGAAKSAMAKAIGNEADIPTILFDLSATMDSLVGNSEKFFSTALAVIGSVTGGRPLFIMTCNAISVLPPELRRRFTLGTIYFDLPDDDERPIIWDIYKTKYNLQDQATPDSNGWTGAEIRQCADMADRLGCTLLEAARFVVPVSISARESITRLRQEASGRYLSASQEGVYTFGPQTGAATRKVNFN